MIHSHHHAEALLTLAIQLSSSFSLLNISLSTTLQQEKTTSENEVRAKIQILEAPRHCWLNLV